MVTYDVNVAFNQIFEINNPLLMGSYLETGSHGYKLNMNQIIGFSFYYQVGLIKRIFMMFILHYYLIGSHMPFGGVNMVMKINTNTYKLRFLQTNKIMPAPE